MCGPGVEERAVDGAPHGDERTRALEDEHVPLLRVDGDVGDARKRLPLREQLVSGVLLLEAAARS